MLLRRRTVTIGLLGAAALRQAPALAQATDEQSLYEAAKKEGRITWYSGLLTQPICDQIASAFTQKYPGIRVDATKTTSEVAFQRVMQDINGGKVQADVFTTTDASHMSYLAGKGKLVKFTPENDKNIVDAARSHFDSKGYYTVTHVLMVALVYNTKKVKPEEAPKDWPDLADPKWKNQVAFGSPNYSGLVATWTVAMNEKLGWDYFDKLNKNNPLIGRSIDDGVAVLNSGEREVAICSPGTAFLSISRGNPLAVNYASSFTVVDFCPSAVLAGSPSPNAAKLFMEFLTGKEHADIMVKNFEQPLRADVQPPKGAKALSELTLFMPTLDALEKEIPVIKNKWRDTFS